jgi:hypothetical protein
VTILLLTISNFFLGLGQSLNSADLYEIEFERTKSGKNDHKIIPFSF